jgi:acetolactate synthase-1/2/3 large subunit
MNGAESLARTLVACGVDTCFANPGTSEMNFVAALDQVPEMRCILGLAEIVVTGCADGYARIAGRPAATLLHCGPGFANGWANVHNARRANTPMVNVVGDHATYHVPYDTPLTSDVEGLARTASDWVRTTRSPQAVGADAAAAVQAACTAPGRIATLILPADMSWSEGGTVAAPLPAPGRTAPDPAAVKSIAQALRRRESAVLFLSDQSLTEAGLVAANRVAHATGARLRAPTQVPHIVRGRGRVPVDRLPYVMAGGLEAFASAKHVVLSGSKPPAQFFAYPSKPSLLYPPEAMVHLLATPVQDQVAALNALADELGAPQQVPIPGVDAPAELPRGKFESIAFGQVLAALLPENCIVAEDAVSSGRPLFSATFHAAPHDWIQITGGAIGHGLPCATGAAAAARDRKVICLQADGAGMYSPQALWTQAREKLDVINVIFANRIYRILQGELTAVGAKPGPASKELLDIARPEIDWVGLAASMGVEGKRVDTLESFADVFRAACARRGPFLIEFLI